MKIIYLHQYFNTPQMPGATRSYEMARRLVAAGHEVHIVTSWRDSHSPRKGGWSKTEEAGIHVHWLPVPYSNAMRSRQRLKAFCTFAFRAAPKAVALKGDVVFATSTPLTIAIPGVYAAKRNRIPMVFEVRDLWPELPIAMGVLNNRGAIAAARWLERFAYRNATRVVALSPGMRDGVVRTGYPEERVHVIPNSADLELFDVPPEVGQEFRAQHHWLGDRPLILYAGALGQINGVDYLVRVASSMKRIAPHVRFLILGQGAEEAKVRQWASESGVLDSTLFMWKEVPKAEMPAVLSAATMATSLFIDLPAMRANSANKFFDALAAGRPITINYGGWQAELIEEHGCGLVLDPNDPQAAAEQLASVVRDRGWLEQAGQNARALAEGRFSRDKLAHELQCVLRTAATEGRRARRRNVR